MVPAEVAKVTPIAATRRWRSELSECCSTAFGQRLVSNGAAPAVFTVSRPPIASTSTDCLSRPSPIARAESRSSAGWVSQPTRITSGTIKAGTSTTEPPIIQTISRVSRMNGTSTTAVSVAEAKKSRSASSSRIMPASAPVEPFFSSSRIASSRSNTDSPMSRSIWAPAWSTK